MGAKVEIYLDLEQYGRIFADNAAQRVSAKVKNFARKFVAVGTGPEHGRLRNSIRVDKVGAGLYEVITDTPYSLAQEFGRPDLKKYTFTPYMRPAAFKTATRAVLTKLINEASEVAIARSRTR